MTRLIQARRRPGHDEVFGPDSEHLKFIGLDTISLKAGESVEAETGPYEIAGVILTGRLTIRSGDQQWRNLGGRSSVFDGNPASFYVPARSTYRVEAETDTDVVVVKARSEHDGEPFVVMPEEVSVAERGRDNWRRTVRDILTSNAEGRVGSIVLGETISYPGEWSSYPPHKHDGEFAPDEPNFEEIYYFQIDPCEGFGVQLHYTKDRSLDDAHVIRSGDAFAIERGYHPVAVAGGYRLYYLWVMAGDTGRALNPYVDPDQRQFL